MKYFVRIASIIILLSITCFLVIEYAINENTQIEQIAYEQSRIINNSNEIIKENTIEDNSQINESNDKLDIFSLLKSHEKYGIEYETKDGEKYTILGMVRIPKIDLEYDILSSTSDALMNISINRYWGPEPHEVGNMCIIGHNYNDSKFFANLYKLTIGDTIEITDACGKTLNYFIYDKFVSDPYNTSCTSQLTNGETEITLITCHDYGRTRLVIKARAEEDKNKSIITNIINNLFKNIEI